ncbi:MAG: hypothetical protein P8O83_02185 [Flavobacteriaceae bacterium]|nr:hypothetical protein [Flavobacteriaceae bacterium]
MNKLSSIFEHMEIQYTVKGKNCLRLLNYEIIIEEYVKRGEKVDPHLFCRIFRLLKDEEEQKVEIDHELLDEVTNKALDEFEHIYFEGKRKEPLLPAGLFLNGKTKYRQVEYSFKDLIAHTLKSCLPLTEEKQSKKEVLNKVYTTIDNYVLRNFNKKHQKEMSHYKKVCLSAYLAIELSLYEELKIPATGDSYSKGELFEIGKHHLKHHK